MVVIVKLEQQTCTAFQSVLRTESSESRLAPYEFIPELRKNVFGNPGMGIII